MTISALALQYGFGLNDHDYALLQFANQVEAYVIWLRHEGWEFYPAFDQARNESRPDYQAAFAQVCAAKQVSPEERQRWSEAYDQLMTSIEATVPLTVDALAT